MNQAKLLKNLFHKFISLLFIFRLLLFVNNFYNSFELADGTNGGFLSGLVLLASSETEPRLLDAARLATLNIEVMEYWFRENFLVIF